MGLFDDLAKDKALSFGLLNSGLSILANNRGANKGIPSILSGLQNGISGYTTMDKFLREKRIKDKTEARQNELMHRLSGGAYGQGNQSSQSQLPPINRPRNNQIGINGGGLTGQGFDSPSQTDIADTGQISQQMPPASTDTTANSNSMSLDPQHVLALAMQYPDLELSKQLIDSVKASQFYVPKFKADNQIVNLGNGKLGIAKFDDKGNETISELTPAEKTKILNLGGQTLQTGEYTGNPVGIYQNTASPGEMLTDARGRASLAQSDRHHADNMALSLRKLNAEHGTQGSLPPLKVEQQKAINFTSRMAAADRVLSQMPTLTAADQLAIATSGGNLKNYVSRGLSQSVQKYIPVIKDFIAANKYGDSGAAVTKQEWDVAFDQFIPVAGDTPGKIRQKAINRSYAIASKKAGIPNADAYIDAINNEVTKNTGNYSSFPGNANTPQGNIKFIIR
jgi:hypothetical protein